MSMEPRQKSLPSDPFGTDPDAPSETYGDGDYVVTIDYGPVGIDGDGGDDPDPDDPETYMEVNLNGSAEFLTIPAQQTKGRDVSAANVVPGPGGAVVNQAPNMLIHKIIPHLEKEFTWKYALNPNFSEIISQLGTVNEKPYTWLHSTEAETWLFQSFSGRRNYLWAPTRGIVLAPYELTWTFAMKRFIANAGGPGGATVCGWNHFYRPKDGKFVRVLLPGIEVPVYPADDFADMFRAPGF